MIDTAAAICKAFWKASILLMWVQLMDKCCSTEHPVYILFYETKKKNFFYKVNDLVTNVALEKQTECFSYDYLFNCNAELINSN